MLSAQPRNLYFHHIGTEDGLSQTNSQNIFQDSRGLIWASSLDGVNRFDGHTIKVWKPDPRDTAGMAGSNVQSNFFEDQKSNLWFCTFEALNCYQRDDDLITHFQDKDGNGGPLVGYSAFHLDTSGLLWLIEQRKTLCFFDTRAKRFLHDRYDLMSDIQKSYFLTDGQGQRIVLSFRGDTTGICVATLLPKGGIKRQWLLGDENQHPGKYVVGGWPENDTLVWIAHFQGFGALNLQTGRFTEYFQTPKGSDLFPRDVSPLDAKRLLVAFGKNGVFIFDKDTLKFTGKYTYLPEQPHAAPMSARNVFRFAKGDIFINEVNQGISFTNLQKSKFATLLKYDPKRKSSNLVKVRALAEDHGGNTWCLTIDDHLIVLDQQKRVITWNLPDALRSGALPKTEARFLFIDRTDRVWILTWDGLWISNAKRQTFRQLTGVDQVFLHVIQLRDGRMLFTAAAGGIYELKEAEGKFNFEKISTISDHETFTTLFQDKSGLLYACRELTAIKVFDPNQNFKAIKTMPVQGEINAWYEPPNGDLLWIATSYGLVKYPKNGNHISLFNEKNGLPDQNIYAVLPDSSGYLWLSSNRGIIRFNPVDSSAHTFTLADGLPALEFNTFAWFRKNNGELWFGSMGGITAFHPDSIHYLPAPARVLVTNILVNDQKPDFLVCARTGAHNPMEIHKLVLPYSKRTLSLEFVAPEYADPAQVQYRYRLEGYDKNWVEAGSRGFARFANLPPAKYVLLLLASNSDGVWMKEPTRFEIEIVPPIWLRWWFILLGVMVFISTIWYATAIYYRRREHISRLKAEKELAVEKERLRISRDLHDDLGSGLGAIGLLSDIALSKTGSPEMSAEVSKIADSAHELSAKVREIIWAASAHNDTLNKLVNYLHQYAISLFEDSDIELFSHLPNNIPTVTIPGDHRRALFLAFKEALHNIIKHSGATQVSIKISFAAQHLQVSIHDNGRGFDPTTIGDSGNGLLNMRLRLEEIKGQFLLESGGRGTTVTLLLPL